MSYSSSEQLTSCSPGGGSGAPGVSYLCGLYHLGGFHHVGVASLFIISIFPIIIPISDQFTE